MSSEKILKIISIRLKWDTKFQIFIFVMIHEILINRPDKRRLKIKMNRTRVTKLVTFIYTRHAKILKLR